MQDEIDVLVVGAGPVGLLLATELARDGLDVVVIDRLRQRDFFCKALGVTARTLEVFEDLGIVQDAIDAGVWLRGIAMFDDGKPGQTMDLPTGLPYGALSLPQFDTERLLEQALRRHGKTVDYGWTLTGLSQTPAGVIARADSAEGQTREMRCRWLVGCDGAHSKVRSELGLEFSGAKYPQTFVLADVEIDWDLARGRAYRFNHSGAMASQPLAAIPIHGSASRYRLSTVMPDESVANAADGNEAVPDLERVKAIMLPLLPPGTALRSLHWSSVYRVSHRIVSRYGIDRVFVAGDAAHIHPPVGGQGMNTGLQDAHNLAWKLALAARGLAAPTLLDSYSAERRPVGVDVVEETSRSMNDVLAQKSRLPGMRETQLLVGYRGSPIVAGESANDTDRLSPGDRAPDVGELWQRFVQRPLRLRERIGGGCHLLLGYVGTQRRDLDAFGAMYDVLRMALGGAVRAMVVASPDVSVPDQEKVPVFVDTGRKFQEAYGAGPIGAWLIRPDGYVGWCSASPSVDSLGPYLRAIAA